MSPAQKWSGGNPAAPTPPPLPPPVALHITATDVANTAVRAVPPVRVGKSAML